MAAQPGALAMWIPAIIVIAMGGIAYFRSVRHSLQRPHHDPQHADQRHGFLVGADLCIRGIETASFLGDEIKNARRAIPWALFLGGITVALCYIVGTVAVLLALPSAEVGNLQGLMQAISSTAHKVIGIE